MQGDSLKPAVDFCLKVFWLQLGYILRPGCRQLTVAWYAGNICVYCPGGPDSDFEYSTQSYTGYEPTSMRAIRARYNPYIQARARVDQLRRLGHSVDKVTSVPTCISMEQAQLRI